MEKIEKNKKSKTKYYRRIIITYIMVLVFPLIVFSFYSYFSTKKQTLEFLDSSLSIEVNRQLTSFNRMFEDFYNNSNIIKAESVFLHFNEKNIPINEIELMQFLRNIYTKLNPLDALYYYNADLNNFYGGNGKYSVDFFANNIVRFSDSDLNIIPKADELILAKKVFSPANNTYGVLLSTKLSNVIYGNSCVLELISDESFKSYTLLPHSLKAIDELIKFNDKALFSNNKNWNDDICNGKNIDESIDLSKYIIKSFIDGNLEISFYISKALFKKDIFKKLMFPILVSLFVLLLGIPVLRELAKRNYKPIKSLMKNIANDESIIDSIEEVSNEFEYLDFLINEIVEKNKLLELSNEKLINDSLFYTLLSSKIVKDGEVYKKIVAANIRLDRKALAFVIFTKLNPGLYDIETRICENLDDTDFYEITLPSGLIVVLITSNASIANLQEELKVFSTYSCVLSEIMEDVSLLYDGFKTAQMRLYKLNLEENDSPNAELEELRVSLKREDYTKAKYLLDSLLFDDRFKNDSIKFYVYIQILIMLKVEIPSQEIINKKGGINYEKLYFRITTEFNKILQDNTQNNAVEYRQKNIKEILQYIDEHYTDYNFSVKSLASDFNTSASNISHFFKKNTGKTFSEYVTEKKLQKTKELLEQGDLKVSEISSYLGFNNVNLFIQLFKKHEGVTPKKYIISNNNLEE